VFSLWTSKNKNLGAICVNLVSYQMCHNAHVTPWVFNIIIYLFYLYFVSSNYESKWRKSCICCRKVRKWVQAGLVLCQSSVSENRRAKRTQNSHFLKQCISGFMGLIVPSYIPGYYKRNRHFHGFVVSKPLA